ncbi:RadC family protein [Paraburkholderia unamae]|uniref:DNA replication and repair protein RadC n=1 Tax=Paraburkholderia unamae TaxID=219649 RepID=A0ABX5KIH5_9BURK|nr:DNA repair protein RadC [Paraburkholderia unamae]PVX77778.1 DNA replication and repair protein RadC [Paraburkholderia unamae]RAR58703.1 DNA replication and repair protein RadC [Paraburkholderia unamae]
MTELACMPASPYMATRRDVARPAAGCAERGPGRDGPPATTLREPPLAVLASDSEAPAARPRDMPRERLRAAGPTALSDVELIAILLGSGLPGYDVFEVARSLLAHFGSLRAMLDAQREEFESLRGIGPAKASVLQAVTELARRALAEALDDKPLVDSPGAVEDYLRLLIGGRPHEVFVCLFLDARHRLIRSEESSRGSLTRMAVYPREIVRRALMLNAASLIVAHNHPSGAVQPSASDRRLTRVLRETLALVEVQLIDHLVIGARETFSFARHGWN